MGVDSESDHIYWRQTYSENFTLYLGSPADSLRVGHLSVYDGSGIFWAQT